MEVSMENHKMGDVPLPWVIARGYA